MIEKIKSKRTSKYLVLMFVFLLLVNITLGILLMGQSKTSIISLMHTRMLDVSNTAAAMIDGDVLETVTPADKGTDGYESIMKTLSYFQDNIDLKYIYCIRDMGDGTFTFGLDPTVEDPGEFGSPIVYTDALYQASKGIPAADDNYYEDAWGTFYSSYSPVFNSRGEVAGIIAVDFSAEWYEKQLAAATRIMIIVAVLSLLIGAAIVITIISKNEKRIGAIRNQLGEMETTLMGELGSAPVPENPKLNSNSIDSLGKQIQSMQTELKTQIAHIHGQAYTDGLTGVKSRQAYLELESALDEKILLGMLPELAVVVCDVNGLKKINDTQGHKAGDQYICNACAMICDVFTHSPVYRFGGDEFTVILTGRDYENRTALMYELHKTSILHISTNDAIVSGGMAEYIPGKDHSIYDVFERADAAMYKEKMLLKTLGAETREEEAVRPARNPEYDEIQVNNVRRHLLIADDVEINREILGDLLEEDYDILYASDGVETMELLQKHKDEIAILLLDLYMPNMNGREVMRQMQVDEDLMSIPVIVITVDQDAELDCLKLGAMDFISKPYPDIEIIKARISKCIELTETRDLIRQTQRDKLTGLFNVDYFLRYVDLFDHQNKETVFDAIVCDINDFRAFNEQYGRKSGDLVLRSIGIGFRQLVRKTGGIGCRKGIDTFCLYCPHQDDYEQLLKKFLSEVFFEKETASKVGLRFGVYVDARHEPDIEERFACAALAADRIRKDPQKICGFYSRSDSGYQKS